MEGERLTAAQIIERVNTYQEKVGVHHLLCGNDRRHRKLVPRLSGEVVILYCPDCDFRQGYVPEVATAISESRLRGWFS